MTPLRRMSARSFHMIETHVHPIVAMNPIVMSHSRYSGPAERNATLVRMRTVDNHLRYQSAPFFFAGTCVVVIS